MGNLPDFEHRSAPDEVPYVPPADILVTLTATLSDGGTATATVDNGNGGPADGSTVTVNEVLGTNGTDIESGKKCIAMWLNGTGWAVKAAGC